MKNNQKEYTVTLLDDTYTLISDDNEQHIQEVTQCISGLVNDIAQQRDIAHNNKKVIVLAALRIASDLINLKKSYQEVEEKSRGLIRSIDSLF